MKLELMQNEDKLLEEMHKLETEKQVKITQPTRNCGKSRLFIFLKPYENIGQHDEATFNERSSIRP